MDTANLMRWVQIRAVTPLVQECWWRRASRKIDSVNSLLAEGAWRDSREDWRSKGLRYSARQFFDWSPQVRLARPQAKQKNTLSIQINPSKEANTSQITPGKIGLTSFGNPSSPRPLKAGKSEMVFLHTGEIGGNLCIGQPSRAEQISDRVPNIVLCRGHRSADYWWLDRSHHSWKSPARCSWNRRCGYIQWIKETGI